MTTSASTNFSLNRDALIKSSLRLINVGTEGYTPSAAEMQNASDALNMLLKAWQADGLQLWAQKRATLFLANGTASYNLGTSGTHATSSYTETAIKVAASGTTIDVDSTSGMAASDYIGIVLDDDTLHWTTVSSVTDSDTVVIATALPSAAAVDNKVYFYTTKIYRPLRITEMVRRSGKNDITLNRISRDEYFALGDKTTSGTPNQYYYDPQLDSGVLYLYQPPSDVDSTIEFIYHRPFEDFDTATDTPDFPQEWYHAVRFGLAVTIAPEYGVPLKVRADLKMDAMYYKREALNFDREDSHIYIQPDLR